MLITLGKNQQEMIRICIINYPINITLISRWEEKGQEGRPENFRGLPTLCRGLIGNDSEDLCSIQQ